MPYDADALNTQHAMNILHRVLPDAFEAESPAVQARFSNALLNVAVHQLIAEEGQTQAATLLWRLADTISTGNDPDYPVELTRMDA